MRVAAFMSGSGTNVIRLFEREKELEKESGGSPFHIIFIFSDRSDGGSAGEKIALDNGIPYFSYDIRKFYSLKGLKRSAVIPETLSTRRDFDSVASRLIKAFDIDIIALAGYMSYLTLRRCVNVHPADLSLLTIDGKRRYVGDYAVGDAIAKWRDCSPFLNHLDRCRGRYRPHLDGLTSSYRNLTFSITRFTERPRKSLKKVVDEHQMRLKRGR